MLTAATAGAPGDSSVTAGVTVEQPTIADPNFGSSGGFGGGQLGYNWQRGRLVFGIEADIQASGINGSGTETVTDSGGSGIADAKNSLDWFGTVRGRLGYTFDNALVYGTGGFAYGAVRDKLSVTASYGGSSATQTVQEDRTATGYAVGGGMEYALNPAWSLKAEYQYINLGNDKLAGTEVLTTGGVTVTATGQANFDHAYNTVRLGVNYRIHQADEPLK